MAMIKKEAIVAQTPVPSLPKSTIGATPAPGGESPVRPAGQIVTPMQKFPPVTDDKMSKQDWANKDVRIEQVAIVKSVLESPAYAQLVVGRRLDESLDIGSQMVRHFLGLLNDVRK